MENKMKTNNRPVNEVKIGRVKASIWSNSTKHGPRYAVTVGRLFKPEDGPWQTSPTLDRDDLLTAAKVLDLAHSWIIAQPVQAQSAEGAEQPDPLRDFIDEHLEIVRVP